MKIIILGATGRTGQLLLKEALSKGYSVNCLVRSKGKVAIRHKDLKVFEGTPTDKETLLTAVEDCTVLLNTLNISRTSDFPWSRLRTPKKFLSDVMKNITSLSEKTILKRVVICSAWGVAETKPHLPGWFKWFIDNSNIGAAYQDHERQEALLQNSTLAWTIVRPVGLINSKKAKSIIESFENRPKPKLLISRTSVAKYMVDAIDNDSLIKQLPVISNQ